MYTALLVVHSTWRWLVVALGLIVLWRFASGWRARRPFGRADARWSGAFMGAVDVQLLLGAVLWWLSPYGALVRTAFAASMKDALVRFWGLEHPVTMLVAVAVVHIGNARAKRRGEGWQRHRTLLIGLAIWVVLVAAAFPWPGLARGRPLLRF
jgi:hypothetical protein